MKKLLFILAAAGLLLASCNKPDNPSGGDDSITKSDLVGSWGTGDTPTYVFKEDGSYTEAGWDGSTVSGKWALDGSKLTFTPTSGDAREVDIVLTGGKAWLVFIGDYEDEYSGKTRMYESYRKIGARVDSGTLGNGRWDCPRDGIKPASYTKDADYNICLIVEGSKVDLYVPAWGMHIQGTFTLADGKFHIDTDDDHIWKAAYKEGNAESGSIGWQAGNPPTDDFEATWDYSYGSMDAETFKLQSPYVWYTINEILAMGKKPDPNDPEYKSNPWMFQFMLYEFGLNEHDIAMDLCDMELCVTADGKEAYGNGAARLGWLYKR